MHIVLSFSIFCKIMSGSSKQISRSAIERYSPVIIGIPFLCLVVCTGVYVADYSGGSSNSCTCKNINTTSESHKLGSGVSGSALEGDSNSLEHSVAGEPVVDPESAGNMPSAGVQDSGELVKATQKEVEEAQIAKAKSTESRIAIDLENNSLISQKSAAVNDINALQASNKALQDKVGDLSTIYGISEVGCKVTGALQVDDETAMFRRRRATSVNDLYLYNMNIKVSLPSEAKVTSTGHMKEEESPKFTKYCEEENYEVEIANGGRPGSSRKEIPLSDTFRFTLGIAEEMNFEVWDYDIDTPAGGVNHDESMGYFLFTKNEMIKCGKTGVSSAVTGVKMDDKTSPTTSTCHIKCVAIS